MSDTRPGESKIVTEEVAATEAAAKKELTETEARHQAEAKRRADEREQSRRLDFAKRYAEEHGWPMWDYKGVPSDEQRANFNEIVLESGVLLTLIKDEGIYKRIPERSDITRYDVCIIKTPEGGFSATPTPPLASMDDFERAYSEIMDFLAVKTGSDTIRPKWSNDPQTGAPTITTAKLEILLRLAEQKQLGYIFDDQTKSFLKTLPAREQERYLLWEKRLNANRLLNQLGPSSTMTNYVTSLNKVPKASDEFKLNEFNRPLRPSETLEQAQKEYLTDKMKDKLYTKQDGTVITDPEEKVAAIEAEMNKLIERKALVETTVAELNSNLVTCNDLLNDPWRMLDKNVEGKDRNIEKTAAELASTIVARSDAPEKVIKDEIGSQHTRTVVRHDPQTVVARVEKYMKQGEADRAALLASLEKEEKDISERQTLLTSELRSLKNGIENTNDKYALAKVRAQRLGEEAPERPTTYGAKETAALNKIDVLQEKSATLNTWLTEERAKISEIVSYNNTLPETLLKTKERVEEERQHHRTSRPIK